VPTGSKASIYWTDFNDSALRVLVKPHPEDPDDAEALARKRLEELMNLFIDERQFSSDFDMTIREWAQEDPTVAKQVARIDKRS
jgi:hypothetical protein